MSSVAGVRRTSTATSVSFPPGTPSTTPTPSRVSPGSTPSTRTARSRLWASLAEARHLSEHLFGRLPVTVVLPAHRRLLRRVAAPHEPTAVAAHRAATGRPRCRAAAACRPAAR